MTFGANSVQWDQLDSYGYLPPHLFPRKSLKILAIRENEDDLWMDGRKGKREGGRNNLWVTRGDSHSSCNFLL